MQIEELYAAAVVSDIDRAEEFYTALLGRGPDDRPMDGLIQWRDLAGGAGLQVVLDPDGNRLTLAEPPTGLGQ